MCGFAGYLNGYVAGRDCDPLERMTDAITHRGPDSAGYWRDPEQHIALGHRRLSIVDLSPAGSQPMVSGSRRYVLAFNGEIYNHQALRTVLAVSGHTSTWRGHSDTETLLAGFDAWGIQATLERCVGMFAFAVWDRDKATLTLGRDRMGEKPLYYGWQGTGSAATFLFGSELKAMRAHPSFQGCVDKNALFLFLRHNYIPAPLSIYSGIAKLLPGHLLVVSLRNRVAEVTAYWNGVQSCAAGQPAYGGTAEEAVDTLEILLKDAVQQQMIADVPLGAFLSGGVDSSLIVALMQAQSSRPVKTFTIGFEESGYNEAEHALQVARYLGTDHTEMVVSGRAAMDVIPSLPALYDEPFSDASQIPTFLLSRLARQDVTVSLSGDGGDELFCGYERYQSTAALWRRFSLLPRPLQKLLGHALAAAPSGFWNGIEGGSRRIFGGSTRFTGLEHKAGKVAKILRDVSLPGIHRVLSSHWHDPASVLIGVSEPEEYLANDASDYHCAPMQQLMLLDARTYLPDDILVKVDRAAMAASLETRAPFLDHRVVEFAWRLPQTMKVHGGQSKWALRQLLYRYVPRGLIERPKMGFGVPVGQWLRGPLRDWAESLLDRARLRDEGYFRPELIRQKWEEHLSGKHCWQYHLWDVLMFESWLEQNRSGDYALQGRKAVVSSAMY